MTWIVQILSVREMKRNRMTKLIDTMNSEEWEIVCLTELRAEGEQCCG